jgi:1-acyl-sn-glycerol-3-phosphate acyltransferase
MADSTPPPVQSWFQNGFHAFLQPFLKRHFHAVAIDRESRCDSLDESTPLIVYGNHASWWDPLMAHFLNRTLFPGRQFYAPIDADALEQYRVFGKLGFYGVRMDTTSGAAAFLSQSTAILQSPQGTAIWITPEGRFSDVRDHSAALMPGLAHLCTRMRSGYALPIALEYVFWDERLSVCLVKMGTPIPILAHSDLPKAQWSELLTSRLRETQLDLSELAITRSSEPFENLIRGRTGAGFVYDSFRRIKSWATGRRFRSQHGKQFE